LPFWRAPGRTGGARNKAKKAVRFRMETSDVHLLRSAAKNSRERVLLNGVIFRADVFRNLPVRLQFENPLCGPRLCVRLWIIDSDLYRQSVMVNAAKSFAHVHGVGMRKAHGV